MSKKGQIFRTYSSEFKINVIMDMRNKGYVINHKTVQTLMKQLGLKGKQRKNDKLLKENEQLKNDVERLKKRLKIERQVTHGNYSNKMPSPLFGKVGWV